MKAPTFRHDVRNACAFTLVETLVAMAILTMMALSLYAGLSSGFLILKTTREELRATQVLAQKMEAIRLCTWSQLSNCPTSFRRTITLAV